MQDVLQEPLFRTFPRNTYVELRRKSIGQLLKGTVSRDGFWLLLTCMVSFRPKKRKGPVLNFLGAPTILYHKKGISRGKCEFTLA